MAADPFALLNRVLDSRHTQPGAIRKACMAVEDCIVNNRCLPQRGTALTACMAICTATKGCVPVPLAAVELHGQLASPFVQRQQCLHSEQSAPSQTAGSRCRPRIRAPRFRDNLRGFFDKCFPNLLKRIFGYDDFEASWLNMVTKVGAYQQNAFRKSRQ